MSRRPDLQIPVLDLAKIDGAVDGRADLVDTVRRSAEEVGFFIAVNHGVSSAVIERMVAETTSFFGLPLEDKMRMRPGDDRPIGFRPVATGALAQELQPGVPPDLMEVFRYEPYEDDDLPGVVPMGALFPTEAMRSAWLAYIDAMIDLATRILRLFAVALEVPPDWFERFYRRPKYKQIANHYPPQIEEPQPGQLQAGVHTDYGVLTILHQDDAPGGLQVVDRRTGQFHDAPYVPDSFVLNLGDLMAHWTNDLWVSTVHRVVNPPRDEAHRQRISLPFFFNPDEDALVETLPSCVTVDRPAKYEPLRAGDWVMRRRTALIVDESPR